MNQSKKKKENVLVVTEQKRDTNPASSQLKARISRDRLGHLGWWRRGIRTFAHGTIGELLTTHLSHKIFLFLHFITIQFFFNIKIYI